MFPHSCAGPRPSQPEQKEGSRLWACGEPQGPAEVPSLWVVLHLWSASGPPISPIDLSLRGEEEDGRVRGRRGGGGVKGRKRRGGGKLLLLYVEAATQDYLRWLPVATLTSALSPSKWGDLVPFLVNVEYLSCSPSSRSKSSCWFL